MISATIKTLTVGGASSVVTVFSYHWATLKSKVLEKKVAEAKAGELKKAIHDGDTAKADQIIEQYFSQPSLYENAWLQTSKTLYPMLKPLHLGLSLEFFKYAILLATGLEIAFLFFLIRRYMKGKKDNNKE